MRARTLAAGRPDALVPALGALATVVTAWLTVHMGVTVGAGLVLTVTFFLGAVLLFLFQPNVAVAAMIPIFATIPVLKLFVTPWVGPLKDAIALAAIVAAVLLILFERNRPRLDGPLLGLMGLFLALYVVNVDGDHGIAWVHGVRLVGEPLLLLVAGMTFLRPGRTLRWAMASLIATALGIAFYGLVQQYLGQWRLVGLGYSFNAEVRTYNGHLRSFGTFDDSFAYAAFLFLGAVAVLFWMRQTVVALACLTLIAFGVAASYERTALLIAVGLIAVLLARFGWGTSAALVLAAAVAVAFAFLLGSSGSESRAYGTPNTVVTLNGRVAAWKSAFGSPLEWGVGQGVGKIGTAAQRATTTFTPRNAGSSVPTHTKAVDSGYFATVADVGLAGLTVLLLLLGRLGQLAWRATRHGGPEGWLAAGFLAVLVLDASTRSSFTGFPTAFLGFPFIGFALAAAGERARAESPAGARHGSPGRLRPLRGARAPAA